MFQVQQAHGVGGEGGGMGGQARARNGVTDLGFSKKTRARNLKRRNRDSNVEADVCCPILVKIELDVSSKNQHTRG